MTSRIEGATINAEGSVEVEAHETAEIQALAVGAAGGRSYSFGGSVAVNIITNTTRAFIKNADVAANAPADAVQALTAVTASGNVIVSAENKAAGMVVAGGLGVSVGSNGAAMGAGVTTFTVNTTTEAFIDGGSAVRAGYQGPSFTDKDGRSGKGVLIEALSETPVSIFAVAGAAAPQTAALAGALSVTTVKDTVRASIATPNARAPLSTNRGVFSERDLIVSSGSDVRLLGVAGALAVGKAAGVGIGIDVGVVTITSEALIGDKVTATAWGSMAVDAKTDFDVTGISAAVGAAPKGVGVAGAAGFRSST